MKFHRKRSFYEKYTKRLLDIICSLFFIALFWWVYLIIAILVKLNLGSPVIFKQPRPGMIDPTTGKERIFYMYKFRSMTDEKDDQGNLLPDERRLTSFGKKLRASSLDEFPELFNILKGDMSIIGPRPQLVRDMVFMTSQQRMRHTAKPGLSGLAQVNGRNSITWEEKLELDLKYIKHITILKDLKLVWMTFGKVFFRANISEANEETDMALDYGAYLLKSGKIEQRQYNELLAYAGTLINGNGE